MLEVVTYANKADGMFDELINNNYGIKVNVLGWQTKWRGFKDKYKAMLTYMESKHDNDIIIFLDGFDSKIMGPLKDVERKFDSFNCKVLFSKEPFNLYDSFSLDKCDPNYIANTGMYMGYVEYLKILLNDALHKKCNDDQMTINKMCKQYNFINIDTTNIIFKNIKYSERNSYSETDATFVSYPGRLTLYKIPLFAQFVFPYVLLMHLLFMALFSIKKIIFISLLITTFYYIIFCDRSCI